MYFGRLGGWTIFSVLLVLSTTPGLHLASLGWRYDYRWNAVDAGNAMVLLLYLYNYICDLFDHVCVFPQSTDIKVA